MNKSVNTLIAAFMLIGAGHALAASSVDLTVRGQITPSACDPSFSNGGVIDYGKLAAKDLNLTQHTSLPRAVLQLAVTCEAPTLFALNTRDNRPDRAQYLHPAAYGLGVINEDQFVGGYFLQMANILGDEKSISSLESSDNGLTWHWIPPEYDWYPDTFTGFGNRSSGVLAPIPIQVLNLDLLVDPLISPMDELTLTETVPLDGSATFELRYL